MNNKNRIKYLKSEIEPTKDQFLGLSYRVAVYLKDGTYLPCVIFRNPEKKINQAIKRFKEERTGKSIFAKPSRIDGYRDIVKLFVTGGNKINDYDIEKVEKSPFAIPENILSTIKGETTMGWTGFVVIMKDDNIFGFGTSYLVNFFKMPDGYVATDIKKIINHSYISKTGELKSHKVPFFERPKDYDESVIYREKPYFECYLDGL